MNISGIDITQLLSTYLLVFFRLSSLLMVAPLTGSQLVPGRYRIALAASISIIIVPLLQQQFQLEILSISTLLLLTEQVIIGVFMGLTLQIMFQVVVIGGEMIAMQSGLGFASLVDPQSRTSVPMVSQIYMLATWLLFLAANGHLQMIKTLVHSFQTLPLNNTHFLELAFKNLALIGSDMFAGAVTLALPAIISLLTVNLTFAIMTRSAPQLNIFTIGFPITLIFGLSIIYMNFTSLVSYSDTLFETSFDHLQQLITR